MNGKDLHVGDWEHGILPAMAPLGSPALTIAGIAMAFALRGENRVAVSFVGEGTTSLGEWHEAINACASRKLPAIFCVQNNQTALSTPVSEQSAVRVFAEKAAGYGMPCVTIDGTDPEAIAAAFTWAAERARERRGPTLIELVAMRMCGHAHHDDMLYLGKDPQPSWTYPPLQDGGYADHERYEFWCRKDPITTYAAKLGETLRDVAPVMDREHRHRRVDRGVLERERLGRALMDGCGSGRTPVDHRPRRLDGDDLAVFRLVRARTCADVRHRSGIAERVPDCGCDARVGASGLRICRADRVVPRHRSAPVTVSTTPPRATKATRP